jgi:DNA-binding MarR family transcriptional regulator
LVRLLPPELPSGKKILWKQVDAEKIEISVDKNSARGGNAKPIVIKRFIEINELLFEGLGLRFGDGIKLQGGEIRVFGFSNTCLELVKYFLKFANECFGINPSQFRVALIIPPKLVERKEEIEFNISNELCIPRNNFYKSRTLERGNMTLINVTISSRLLAFLIQLIFDYMKENVIFSNQLFSACVLRGIIASEANINVRKEGRLGEITIAAEGEEKRNFIRKLLLNLNIQPNKDKTIENQECVCITGLSNFKIIKEWKLIDLNPRKLKDFEIGLNGFKVEQSRKGELRLKVLQLLAEKPRTRQELGKLLNRSPATIKTEALYILENQGFVKRGELNSKSRIWEITEKGLEILKDEKALEKLRSKQSILP